MDNLADAESLNSAQKEEEEAKKRRNSAKYRLGHFNPNYFNLFVFLLFFFVLVVTFFTSIFLQKNKKGDHVLLFVTVFILSPTGT